MAQVVEWLADPRYPVDGIVTHTVRPRRLEAGAGDRLGRTIRSDCIKATLRPNPGIPLVGRLRRR